MQEAASPQLPEVLEPLELAPASLRGLRAGPGLAAGAVLAGAAAHDLRLDEVRLADVELDEAVAPGLRLLDVVAEQGSWANLRAPEAQLTRVEATGVRATGLELAEAGLRDVAFRDCRLDLASFRFATFERVTFVDCRLDEADFHGATLTSVRFERCRLGGGSFEAATFVDGELIGCELDDLRGVDRLRGVRMGWPDVVAIAGLLAAAAGIEVLAED